MKVNREALLKALLSLTPGLEARESIQQSTCIVFTEDGRAMSFNREVCASRKSPLNGIVGAIKAKPIFELLSKLTETDLVIEAGDGELIIKGKGKRKSKLRMEATVQLPVESVDVVEDWTPLDPDFSEAVSAVYACAGRSSVEEVEFVQVCVHIHPNWLEATDRMQIAHYEVKTGLDNPVLVRAESIKTILGHGMTEIAETDSWVHFRNADKLVVSIRKDLTEYFDCSEVLKQDGTESVTLPGGMQEATRLIEVFTSATPDNYVTVKLKAGAMLLEGVGPHGEHKEQHETKYKGPPLEFIVSPKLLAEICKRGGEAFIASNRAIVKSGKCTYVVKLSVPKSKQHKHDADEE